MKRALIASLGAVLFVGACGTTASDRDASTDATADAATPVADAPRTAAQPRAAAPAPAAARPATPEYPTAPSFRELTIPAGTTLSLRLTTPLASDTSRVEDPVNAEFTSPVTVDGRQVVPAGARVAGVVTAVEESARVKGRAQMTIEFGSLSTEGARYNVQTEPLSWLAPATKGEDAVKVGIGAGAGAVVGGILGGKSGAAKGAAVGGAAGTGVVLGTRGEEVRLAVGADVTTRLTAPLTVRLNPGS